MIEIVWEFVVKEKARGLFELAYEPGGAWGKLFSRSPGYRGTTLLNDLKNPRRYLIIDLWDSLDQREQMLADNKDEYANLDANFADWTESENELGIFRIKTKATGRPRGKTRRAKIKKARRTNPISR